MLIILPYDLTLQLTADVDKGIVAVACLHLQTIMWLAADGSNLHIGPAKQRASRHLPLDR